jgi:enamine deaminase RidA (YjgF/YER057c/UK114 family)
MRNNQDELPNNGDGEEDDYFPLAEPHQLQSSLNELMNPEHYINAQEFVTRLLAISNLSGCLTYDQILQLPDSVVFKAIQADIESDAWISRDYYLKLERMLTNSEDSHTHDIDMSPEEQNHNIIQSQIELANQEIKSACKTNVIITITGETMEDVLSLFSNVDKVKQQYRSVWNHFNCVVAPHKLIREIVEEERGIKKVAGYILQCKLTFADKYIEE